MVKKITIALLLFFVIAICGCETTNGASEGAGKDTVNLWQGIKNLDNWIKKNLW